MRLGIHITLAGASTNNVQTGPIRTANPSVSPSTGQEGTQETRTQGTYTARGGGVVTITTSEWRVDGAQVGTAATYTPVSGDVGGVLSYYEVATETGGTTPGTTAVQITVGVVTSATNPNAITDMGDDVITDMAGDDLLDMAA